MSSFGEWDYVVFFVMLAISVGIGVYYRFTGGKQKTTKEFLLADRSMSILPVAFSLMASFMSAITLLGVSAEIYQFGTMFMVINFSYVIATPVAAYVILPVFNRLKTASVYEYLELRFGYATRLCASLAFSLQTVLYMGIVLYAPALALEAVTGLNLVFSIVIIGVVCTLYATLGGMKAVLMADVFQSLLMFIAVFSVIICASIKASGLAAIWHTAEEGGRVEFLNFSIDPTTRHTWWTLVLGGTVNYLSLYGVSQTQVQRLLSVRNLKSSQAALWWNVPILMLLSISSCFSGLCIYWYYYGCDPKLEGRINSWDQIMPLFVVDTMSHIPGLSGLFVSGIFAASLSSISSAISSMSAITVEDYIKPLLTYITTKPLSDSSIALYSKLSTLIYGVICIDLAFLAGSFGGVLQAALSIFGIIGGPLLGLFILGMCIKRANQKGAIIALLLSFAISFWMGFGQPRPPTPALPLSTDACPIERSATSHITDLFTKSNLHERVAEPEEPHYFYLYRISYMWYSTVGFLLSFFGGMLFSWICEKFGWDSNARIYTDNACTLIKYDLFVPHLAKRLRQKQMPVVVVTGTSSEIDGGSFAPSTLADDTQMTKSATNSTELSGREVEEAPSQPKDSTQQSTDAKSTVYTIT